MRLLVSCLLLFMVSGCTTVYTQNKSGLPTNSIAVLIHTKSQSGTGLIIEQVDGRWRGVGLIKRYELLPGEHSLTVTYSSKGWSSAGKLLIRFNAVAGKTYVIKCLTDLNKDMSFSETLRAYFAGGKWTAIVVDAESGTVVSETSKK